MICESERNCSACSEAQPRACDSRLAFKTRVSQASKPSHTHSHREVLAFDLTCRNVIHIRIAADRFFVSAKTFSRRVFRFVPYATLVELKPASHNPRLRRMLLRLPGGKADGRLWSIEHDWQDVLTNH